MNERHQALFPKDLGAFADFLFEIGIGKVANEGNLEAALAFENKKRE
jgi:hypothetical protein